MSDEVVVETAKAVQETAKVASNALDKGAEFSKFIGRIFGQAFENLGEIARYHTEYWKISNALKLRDKLNSVMQKRGLTTETTLPLRLGLPLLDAATNEDEDSLQNLWANLLASAMTNNKHTGVTKTYIEILKNLDVIDAELLNVIYMIHLGAVKGGNSTYAKVDGEYDFVQLSVVINNLERLDLIKVHKQSSRNEKGDDTILVLHFLDKDNEKYFPFTIYMSVTIIGFYFMRACTDVGLRIIDGGELLPSDDRFEYHKKQEIEKTSQPEGKQE